MAQLQAIIYSRATGRVRRVVDPQADVANVVAFLQSAGAGTGEAAIAYTKQGAGADTALAWQAAVNKVTGKSVTFGMDAADTYAEVNAQNQIVAVHCADPACGDTGPNGGTLVLAPAGCNPAWTYAPPSTFTAPVLVKAIA